MEMVVLSVEVVSHHKVKRYCTIISGDDTASKHDAIIFVDDNGNWITCAH